MFRISYIVILISFAASLSAQEANIISKRNVPVQKKVTDLVAKGNSQFLLTEDNQMIELSKEGAVKLQISSNQNDICALKSGEPLPSNINVDNYTYLTKGDGIYYGCIFDWSYSSRIVKIDPKSGEEEFFWYIKGIPSGMTYKDGKLWYLSNRGGPNSDKQFKSILRSLDGKTSKRLMEITDVPVINAKGLSIDSDGILTTYENESNAIVSFEITE
jgi:hypothetical protein